MTEQRENPVNIVFEGFMGVGKSTIGRAVADILGYQFVDTDDAVYRRAGKSIHDMLVDGELVQVREWEAEVCRELAKLTDSVISTGGGVFIQERNANALRQNGYVVCLERSFEDVYPLISSDPVRVMAYRKSYADLKKLMEERKPVYRRYADLIISSDGDAEMIAKNVVTAYRKIRNG